jgi:hypothetical protein
MERREAAAVTSGKVAHIMHADGMAGLRLCERLELQEPTTKHNNTMEHCKAALKGAASTALRSRLVVIAIDMHSGHTGHAILAPAAADS